MTRRARALTLALGVLAVLAVALPPAGAQTSSGPRLVLDRNAVGIGDKVLVTLQGWPLQEAVSISLCGNAASRGSVDCDLTNSLGYGISGASPVHAVLLRVSPPPMPCPCVILATNSMQTKTAMEPINLIGHPTAPVVGNAFTSPLSVDVHARTANQGLFATLKSSLGGPTTYELTVVVRNRTGEDLTGVQLTARAGRSANDQARLIRIKPPEVLPAGTSWTHKQKVTLAAPVVGRFVWKVAASGAGPTARGESSTRHIPLLLMLLILVLAADLGAIAGRRVQRRRDEANAKRDVDDEDASADVDDELGDEPTLELVGVAGPPAP